MTPGYPRLRRAARWFVLAVHLGVAESPRTQAGMGPQLEEHAADADDFRVGCHGQPPLHVICLHYLAWGKHPDHRYNGENPTITRASN